MGGGLENQGGQRPLRRVRLRRPEGSLRACVCPCSAAPPSEITYGAVAADVLHALLAGGARCLVKLQSLFVLDENSCPLQQEFSLLDFIPTVGSLCPGPCSESGGGNPRSFKEDG